MIYLLGIISIFIIIAHVQAFPPPTKPYRHGETLLHAGLNGAALLLENISISRGADQIISNLDLRVERNERWGIVGANGSGKSTLLGSIMGTVRTDEGRVLVAPKLRVGYLRQTAVSGSMKTVGEESMSEMEEINSAKEKMKNASKAIEDGDTSDTALNMLDKATARFNTVGGWTQAADADSVLKGIGFLPGDSERLCSEFSGGWQMRIALARLLLGKPDVLLLDEPSNHLDSNARDWLGEYLSNYEGSIVLVSHDTFLLSTSVNNIAEVCANTLMKYRSFGYDKYLIEKEFRAKSMTAEYERNVAEAARLQAFVDKFGASATKAASAQSRVKMIEKMRKEGKLEIPAIAVVKKNHHILNLPDPTKAIGDTLIELRNADIGYASSVPLLKGISFKLNRGMKVILRGANGSGKSSLMASLRKNLPLMAGKLIENEKLRVGMFTQDLAQELDVEARAIDLVTAYAREGEFGDVMISDQQARGVMGTLGLRGDKPLCKVGELSGGEKARVALSMFALKASNVLMLDEPSNHLDLECIEALSISLKDWEGKDGAVVIISHDRSFCEKIKFTHVGTVTNGSLVLEQRDINDSDWEMFDNKESRLVSTNQPNKINPTDAVPTNGMQTDHKVDSKRAHNAPKRIKKLEQMIQKSEMKITELEDQMMDVGNDVGKLTDISNEIEKEQKKVTEMFDEWDELELIVESFL